MGAWWQDLFSGPWEDARLASPADPGQVLHEAAAISRLLGLMPGERVLELPSGDGRLTRALAAWGLRATGVDISPTMVAASRARSAVPAELVELVEPAEFVEGDMRDLPFESAFDAVFCSHGSFGYFPDEENAAVVRSAFRALRPGGRFLLHTPSLECVLPRFCPYSSQPIQGGMAYESAVFDPETSRVESTWWMVRGSQEARSSSSIRLYSLRELRALFNDCGFGPARAFGSLAGTPFHLNAEVLVLVAARPSPPETPNATGTGGAA